MKVFKFGGGILKTAESIVTFGNIIKKYNTPLSIVVSALGKTTNNLELILKNFVNNNIPEALSASSEIFYYHENIMKSLNIYAPISQIFDQINSIIQTETYSGNYDYEYDRIISQGEVISSVLISSYLNKIGVENELIDIKKCIITDDVYREANVDWEITEKNIKEKFFDNKIYVTQGFIGSTKQGKTTTLGREGSDFTASILAYSLDAESVEFWKEVRGIYNADPSKTNDFVLLPRLSYREAVEQVYYGAKILHPKTIKPLQNKRIQVRVRPFYEPDFEGTSIVDISEFSSDFYPEIPIYILKENQILISVSPRDFSFIDEKNLGEIFELTAKYRIKVNLLQNSAISFSVCVDNVQAKIKPFIERLKKDFQVLYNNELTLITIRHYNDLAISKMIENKKVILQQKSRHTVRFVVK